MDILFNLPIWPFTIIAALLGILGALHISRRNRLATIASNFKAAFSVESGMIRDNRCTMNTFLDAFDKHRTAVDSALATLPKRYIKRVKKAWDEYSGQDIGLDPPAAIARFLVPDLKEEFIHKFQRLHCCLDDLLA